MTGPRFSVVTIVRNGLPFLEEAVDSVRAQTVEDWELHIVDDGSDDGTLDLARDLVKSDPERIHLHRHPGGTNAGMSASRNLGLRQARGEFITWLDHDDVLLPRKLEVLHAALLASPEAVAAIGPNRRWSSWSDTGQTDLDQDLKVEAGVLLPPPALVPTFLEDRQAVPLGPMVRSLPLRSMGGHVEAFRGMHEDQAFLSRLMFRHPVVVVPEVLHLYRQHADSCVTRTHRLGRDLETRRTFLRWLTLEFETAGPRDEPLRELIRSQLSETRGWRQRRWQRWLINARRRPSAR